MDTRLPLYARSKQLIIKDMYSLTWIRIQNRQVFCQLKNLKLARLHRVLTWKYIFLKFHHFLFTAVFTFCVNILSSPCLIIIPKCLAAYTPFTCAYYKILLSKAFRVVFRTFFSEHCRLNKSSSEIHLRGLLSIRRVVFQRQFSGFSRA